MILCSCRLEIGTTYNSYLIFGDDKTCLVDASHEKFSELYLKTLQEQLKKAGRETIDYIVASHTEPDHSGLIAPLVDMYPDVTVAGSKVRATRHSLSCTPLMASCFRSTLSHVASCRL